MKSTIFAVLTLCASAVWACDICATHVALGSLEATHRVSVSLFEQYAKYDATPDGEEEFKSSTTQLGIGYRFSDRWAIQFTAPYLTHELGEESESGFGDVTLLGLYRVVNASTLESITLIDVYAGLKAPTGDTGPLKEEKEAELEEHDDAHGGAEHAHAEGHHLALGSGSWDGIFGANGLTKRGRWQGQAETQYALRSEGAFDFEYGDEFTARAGIRYYALLTHRNSLAVGADILREWSDDNQVLGETQNDTGKAASYLGPALDFTWSDRLTASAAYDVAIEGENKGVHGAADERIRASLTWLF